MLRQRLRKTLGDVREEALVNTLANGLEEVEQQPLATHWTKALVNMLAETLDRGTG